MARRIPQPNPNVASNPDVLKALLKIYGDPRYQSLPDGVYIGLDDEIYHSDTALGSSNIKSLLNGVNQYWFESPLNPDKIEFKTTEGKITGRAMHKMVLEGRGECVKSYVCGPYNSKTGKSMTPAQKSAATKAAKEELLEGQELISGDDWLFIEGVKAVVDADPKLRGVLDGGLSEVSLFYTRQDGVRVRVRWDKLKPGGIGDLKSMANEKRREISVAARLDFRAYNHKLSAEHYLEGRRHLRSQLALGNVYLGGPGARVPKTEDQTADEIRLMAYLQKCADVDRFAFQFIYLPKKGAPDAWSCTLSPGNPMLMKARVDIEVAIDAYKRAVVEFGADKRWLPNHDVEELNEDDLNVFAGW